MQVSSVQYYDTASVYCIVGLPPKVRSPSVTMHLTLFTLFNLSLAPSPLATTLLLSVSISFCLLIFCFLSKNRGLQPLVCGLVLVRGLLGTRLHSRK